ncbi:MAG: O-antigen ligase family protein [Bacteroidetes bacterium]|nr:O-antigen ligase family protein [Bacteroidota bacterium]
MNLIINFFNSEKESFFILFIILIIFIDPQISFNVPIFGKLFFVNICISLFISFKYYIDRSLIFRKFDFFVFAYLIILFVFFSNHFVSDFHWFISAICTFFYFILIRESKINYSLLLHFISILIAISIFLAIYQFLYIPNDLESKKNSISSVFGSPNIFGGICSLHLIIIYFSYKHNIFKLNYAIIFFILSFIGLLLSESRGAIAGLISFVGILIFFNYNRYLLYYIFISFILFIFLINININSSSGRIFAWAASYEIFNNYPLMGIGINQFSNHFLEGLSSLFSNSSLFFTKATLLRKPHNEVVLILVETGIFGFIIFCLFLFFTIKSYFPFFRNSPSFFKVSTLAILFSFIIHSFVDNPFGVFQYKIIFLTFVGILFNYQFYLNKTNSFNLNIFYFIPFFLIVLTINIKLFISSYYYSKGVQSIDNNMLAQGLDYYHKSLQLNNTNCEIMFNIGSTLYNLGHFSEALCYLEKSTQNYSDRNQYILLTYSYLKVGNYSKAYKISQFLEKVLPDQILPKYLTALYFYKIGNYSDAKVKLQNCIFLKTSIITDDVLLVQKHAIALQNLIEKK